MGKPFTAMLEILDSVLVYGASSANQVCKLARGQRQIGLASINLDVLL